MIFKRIKAEKSLPATLSRALRCINSAFIYFSLSCHPAVKYICSLRVQTEDGVLCSLRILVNFRHHSVKAQDRKQRLAEWLHQGVINGLYLSWWHGLLAPAGTASLPHGAENIAARRWLCTPKPPGERSSLSQPACHPPRFTGVQAGRNLRWFQTGLYWCNSAALNGCSRASPSMPTGSE